MFVQSHCRLTVQRELLFLLLLPWLDSQCALGDLVIRKCQCMGKDVSHLVYIGVVGGCLDAPGEAEPGRVQFPPPAFQQPKLQPCALVVWVHLRRPLVQRCRLLQARACIGTLLSP